MISPIRFALLLLVMCTECTAEELLPFWENDRIGVLLRDVGYPESLERDLASGLTNRLLVRLTLSGEPQTERQRMVEISIKYDLWDEIFGATLAIDGRNIAAPTYRSTGEVMAFLRQIRLLDLFTIPEQARSQQFTIRADMLLNPIDGERMDKIQKWVRENSSYMPPDTRDAGRPIGTSTADTVFNRIFQQYAAGANLAAAWTRALSSKPMTAEDLRNARP